MFVEVLKCRACNRPTIHRVLTGAELTDELKSAAPITEIGEMTVTAYAICSECQKWTVQAECAFVPDEDLRRRYDVSWRSTPP